MKAITIVLIFILCCYVFSLVFVFLDLKAGVRKAKECGIFRSSFGYRKTVKKIGEYFSMQLIFSIIDAMQMGIIYMLSIQSDFHVPYIPVFTVVATAIIALIEWKSIKEKKDEKDAARLDEATASLLKIMRDPKNKDAVMNIVNDFNKKNE